MRVLQKILVVFLFCMTMFNLQAQESDTSSLVIAQDSLVVSADTTQIDTIPEKCFVVDTVGVYSVPFIDELICYAETHLGKPYHYGSRGPNSFDCSGFMIFIFSKFGISLSSSSTAQYHAAPIRFEEIDSARQCDLIFFMGRNGRKSVGHVGMVVDVDTATHSCRFIHAATHGGIIETKFPSSAYYNTRFMGFGRYDIPEFTPFYDTVVRECKETPYKEETIENTSDGD